MPPSCVSMETTWPAEAGALLVFREVLVVAVGATCGSVGSADVEGVEVKRDGSE